MRGTSHAQASSARTSGVEPSHIRRMPRGSGRRSQKSLGSRTAQSTATWSAGRTTWITLQSGQTSRSAPALFISRSS